MQDPERCEQDPLWRCERAQISTNDVCRCKWCGLPSLAEYPVDDTTGLCSACCSILSSHLPP